MALCIVRSYARLGRFDGEDVARQFVGWLNTGPPDVGGTTASSLSDVQSGVPWYEGGLDAYLSSPSGAANGSLMRNGVVPAMADTLEEALRLAVHHGIITHYAPLPVLCCIAHTFWIWELLAGRWPFAIDWKQELRARWDAWSRQPDPVTAGWLKRVERDLPPAWRALSQAEFDPHRFNPFEVSFGGGAGYCLLTLQIAAWAVQWSRMDDPFPVPAGFDASLFERRGGWALAWPALVGHDSDTYSAVAGSLIAAFHSKIPAELTGDLHALREIERLSI